MGLVAAERQFGRMVSKPGTATVPSDFISFPLFGALVRKNTGCATFKKPAIISIPAPDCARQGG